MTTFNIKAVLSGRQVPVFIQEHVPTFIFRGCVPKKKASGSSDTLLPVHQAIWHHIPEDRNFAVHRFETEGRDSAVGIATGYGLDD
jgi:hypothetical protein